MISYDMSIKIPLKSGTIALGGGELGDSLVVLAANEDSKE